MTKEQILATLSQSRATLARDYVSVRHELDVQAKLKSLVRRKPLAWLGGAAALGWLLSGPKTKTRVVTKYVKSPDGKVRPEEKKTAARLGWPGVLMAFFRFAMPILKPVLTAYAGRQFATIATKLAK
jgi:hypothetical protein